MFLSYKLFEQSINVPQLGDTVICIGNIDDVKTHNHVGILRKNGVQFLNRFDDKLHNMRGQINNDNGWFIRDPRWTIPFNDNDNGNTIPLKYSDKLKEVLSYSLKFLLDYENIYFADVSYINIGTRSDLVSCLSAENFYKLDNNEDPWTSTMRQNIRIGKFIGKIVNEPLRILENYINEYKLSLKLSKDDLGRFKISKGIEMAKWYLEMYYAQGGGSLHQSCMKHIKSQRRLPIYTNNPEKIKLLYILDLQGKLLGRALLWKLDEPKDKIFMDRVYYTEDYIEKLFLDYANKKGFITKNEVDKMGIVMKVKLGMDYGSPHNNPYMDTFKFFILNGNYLTNKFNNFRAGEYWEYIDHD